MNSTEDTGGSAGGDEGGSQFLVEEEAVVLVEEMRAGCRGGGGERVGLSLWMTMMMRYTSLTLPSSPHQDTIMLLTLLTTVHHTIRRYKS